MAKNSARFSLARLRPGRRTARRNAVALALALLVAVLASALQLQQSANLQQGGPLHALESSVQDFYLRSLRDPDAHLQGLTDAQNPRNFITIVAMDDASLEELGIFRSWPRTYYAQVVENLLVAPPRAIVFDVLFAETSEDDAALVSALETARARRPATAIITAAAAAGVAGPGDGAIQYPFEGLKPIPPIAANSDVASVNFVPDEQGVVRHMPLLVRHGEEQLPSLGLAAMMKYLRRPNFEVVRPSPEVISVAGREIPVTDTSLVRINYFGQPYSSGRPDQSAFKVVSFVDVLRGRVDPATWNNGIVFIGLMEATGFADDYWTPVSEAGRKMSGVEIHANTAATLFSTQFLRDAPQAINVVIIFGLAVLVGLAAANLGIFAAALTALASLALFVVGSALAFQTGTQLAVATPLLAGLLAYIAPTSYRVAVEQRQARALQGALASVIPPQVAAEIARDPEKVRMGGERRPISVLFTDLKGFTTFSEAVDPALLSRVITEYLNGMTNVVFGLGGTVDKFIGDAIMAFWNAPLDDPDHGRHACEAALEMQAALARLGDKWEAEGLPRQYMRVGINTGEVSVGNMGTSQRFAYTALGDAVNLGARLEPLNNEYGTWICISQNTLDAAGGADVFLVRSLDRVAVKGKSEPVPVYELIGRRSDTALVQQYQPILEPYHRAMVLYESRRFQEAAELFRVAMHAGDGIDAPSALYVQRCEELAASPPPAEWDGVFVQKHK